MTPTTTSWEANDHTASDDSDEPDIEEVHADLQPVAMTCTCGARAINVGETIVCPVADTVLWEKGDYCGD